MDKNKTLTEAANDLIEHAMERGIPARMIPFMEALRVANNERKAESEAARLEIESLKAKNLELERLCDATYVTQGADAYNHACSMMEQYQAEREAARKEVGAEGSLCDGISWLYTRIASLESQHEGGKSEALADLAYAHGVGGHARCLLEAASVRLAAVAKPAARGAALATLKHPAVKPNMLVNGGALKLALNVLRRAGKNEVADELEATAQAAPAVPAIGQTLSWEPTYREDFLQLAQKCGAVITGKPDASEAITVVFSVEAWRAFDLATAQAAPVDAAVQEDAERWQFFAEYLVSTRTDLDDEIVGCDSVQKMARVLDAAIAAQKETND